MFSSSCSLCGVLSFACFRGRPDVHRLSKSSKGACLTFIFIFCFGVRSPCRITASTARSSSAGPSSPYPVFRSAPFGPFVSPFVGVLGL